MQEVINYHLNTILKSRIVLDEDMEVIVDNCELCCENRTEICWLEKCKRVSFLCLWGYSVYKYRMYGFLATTPLAAFSLNAFYNAYKLKYYKVNIQSLVEVFVKLHTSNRDIIKYLKVRELFNKSFLQNANKHINCILNAEIDLIDHLMSATAVLCDFTALIQPESWKIQDLRLNNFKTQDDCIENFTKLHDIFILTASKFLACIAVTVSSNHQNTVLNKIVPNSLKFSTRSLHFIQNEFRSARSLSIIEKTFTTIETKQSINNKPTIKLEHSLSKLLTHLQLTYEISQHIYGEFMQKQEKVKLEDLGEQVFALQEQLTLCEQNLDQFCGVYGILIKKSMIRPHIKIDDENNSKKDVDDTIKVIEMNEEEEETRDEEYELYVGDSDGDEFDEKSGFNYEDSESVAGLLLVLQELKDRLKERRIMRAKKLGLPLPEDEENSVVVKVKEVAPLSPPKPQISMPCLDGKAEFTEIGTSSFANAIKLMAQQRQCEEDVFQDSDEENVSE